MIVTLPYDYSSEPLKWAKENCPSYITNDIHMNKDKKWDSNYIDFFFSSEKDAAWFALRWL